MKIMNRQQTRAEDLTAFLEMTKVGEAVIQAGVAVAVRIQGARVACISRVADLDDALRRKQVAGAGMARRPTGNFRTAFSGSRGGAARRVPIQAGYNARAP